MKTGCANERGLNHFRNTICRRGVAAAARYDLAVDDDHADTGDIAHLDAFEQVLACRVLSAVEEHEIGSSADFDQAAVELALPRRVAGCKAEGSFGRHVTQ